MHTTSIHRVANRAAAALKRAIGLGAGGVPGAAAAHPIHPSGQSFGLEHYLLDPFHVAMMGGFVVLVLALLRSVRRRRFAKHRNPRAD
jgi:hypothetical protein